MVRFFCMVDIRSVAYSSCAVVFVTSWWEPVGDGGAEVAGDPDSGEDGGTVDAGEVALAILWCLCAVFGGPAGGCWMVWRGGCRVVEVLVGFGWGL